MQQDNFKMVGKVVYVPLEKFRVLCKILAYKSSYGRDRWLVEPVTGEGEAWVESISEAVQ